MQDAKQAWQEADLAEWELLTELKCVTGSCMDGGSGGKLPRETTEDICSGMEEWN